MLKKTSIILLSALALAACKPMTTSQLQSGPKAASPNYDLTKYGAAGSVKDKFLTITSVKGEMDGDSVTLKDEKGNVYKGVLSIPNLGKDSLYDHSKTKVGELIVVDGEVSKGGSIHITKANNVIVN